LDFYRPNIRKLGNVTIVVPLISIIEIEALYWLLFRNTLLRYAFYLHIQSEFSIVLLWLVTSLRDFQCVYATKTTEKTSRHQLFLLSRVSHEIRTPLFGIVGIVDILDESFVTEEQKKLLATVKACCETALNVVNEILDWSKSLGRVKMES
jgi:signal transduction histidine kinase